MDDLSYFLIVFIYFFKMIKESNLIILGYINYFDLLVLLWECISFLLVLITATWKKRKEKKNVYYIFNEWICSLITLKYLFLGNSTAEQKRETIPNSSRDPLVNKSPHLPGKQVCWLYMFSSPFFPFQFLQSHPQLCSSTPPLVYFSSLTPS